MNVSKALMIQGTTSDAGKTTLVAGLCRLMHRKGLSVAPFKPQNMALNSAVTQSGGEIGRAQALQAQACGLRPHVDMNPVLIKPDSDTGAQIIIQGKAVCAMKAQEFHQYKPIAQKAVLDSYERLSASYEHILVEGAGSPAEINLRQGDIANMGFAEAVDCPVILIADIDKGGVFAHIVGTLDLLSVTEQKRIVGFVINRFRGDFALLKPGLDWLEQKTGKPVLAVLPYLPDFYLDAEDAIDTEQVTCTGKLFKVVVPVFPRISNHTDFDALRLHPQVDLVFVSAKSAPPACDLIILPGSKNVCADLQIIKESGWARAIAKHLRYGGKVIGVCGGFQMLGKVIKDPCSVEGDAEVAEGFGCLPIETIMAPEKELLNVRGVMNLDGVDVDFTGYEIHNGRSTLLNDSIVQPIVIDGVKRAVMSVDEQVLGTYVHGLFDTPEACNTLLKWAGLESDYAVDVHHERECQIERLADVIEVSMDLSKLTQVLAPWMS